MEYKNAFFATNQQTLTERFFRHTANHTTSDLGETVTHPVAP